MKTREVGVRELCVGMVVVGKVPPHRRFRIVHTMPSMGIGPYLTMEVVETGEKVEHDTSFDSRSATYTVEEQEIPT